MSIEEHTTRSDAHSGCACATLREMRAMTDDDDVDECLRFAACGNGARLCRDGSRRRSALISGGQLFCDRLRQQNYARRIPAMRFGCTRNANVRNNLGITLMFTICVQQCNITPVEGTVATFRARSSRFSEVNALFQSCRFMFTNRNSICKYANHCCQLIIEKNARHELKKC